MNKLWKMHHNRKRSIEWHFDCITRHYLERYFPEKFGPALTITLVRVTDKKNKKKMNIIVDDNII